MRRYLSILLLGSLHLHCAPASSEDGKRDGANSPGGTAASRETADQSTNYVHFFSVAWGCVQVEVAKLEAAQYKIQEFTPQTGACPATVPVLTATSKPLLQCPIVIGPSSIPATYVLYDKRTLDGQTVRDMRAEGFTEDNFCPAIAQRTFN